MASPKGTATRTAIVEQAKQMKLAPEQRLQFLLEQSRFETEYSLEKVESLKSKAVKRRLLEEALAAIRTDAVPDEMQRAQIALLEEALRTLDTTEDNAQCHIPS